jgi:hypothetical protein
LELLQCKTEVNQLTTKSSCSLYGLVDLLETVQKFLMIAAADSIAIDEIMVQIEQI